MAGPGQRARLGEGLRGDNGRFCVVSDYELIARPVDALAWPLAAVVLALLLRRQMGQWLTDARLYRIKAGPVELEWERSIEEVRKDVLTIAGKRHEETSGSAGVDHRIEITDPMSVTDELRPELVNAPVVAVHDAFERLVERVRKRLVESGWNGDTSRMNPVAVAALARMKGVIDESAEEVIAKLSALHSLAVHGKIAVSIEEANEFVQLIDALTIFT